MTAKTLRERVEALQRYFLPAVGGRWMCKADGGDWLDRADVLALVDDVDREMDDAIKARQATADRLDDRISALGLAASVPGLSSVALQLQQLEADGMRILLRMPPEMRKQLMAAYCPHCGEPSHKDGLCRSLKQGLPAQE